MLRTRWLPPRSLRFLLNGLHQELTDPSPAETRADDEARDLAAGFVALDEVLEVERDETRELAFDLGPDQQRRGVAVDPLEPLGRLPRARRVAELAEQLRDCGGVTGSRGADLRFYGGGGGLFAGGIASSST